jgi:hypothetical protein
MAVPICTKLGTLTKKTLALVDTKGQYIAPVAIKFTLKMHVKITIIISFSLLSSRFLRATDLWGRLL